MITIMFSIPIHERLDVVIDQIINFKTFNPGCGIVLHTSLGFDYNNSPIKRDEFCEIVKKLGNVYINPKSVRTGKYDIIQAHLSNFDAVRNVEFEYFSMCASNELFVKCGLYEKMKIYDCALDRDITENRPQWITGQAAREDASLRNMIPADCPIIGSQIEGTYYRKEIFSRIQEIIRQHYDYEKMPYPYAREEIYFPTIFWNINQHRKYKADVGGMFTYIPWHRQFTTRVRKGEIKKCTDNASGYFSVKRVDRSINDPIRRYIRHAGCYENQVLSLMGGVIPYGRKWESLERVRTEVLVYLRIIKKAIGVYSKRKSSFMSLQKKLWKSIKMEVLHKIPK